MTSRVHKETLSLQDLNSVNDLIDRLTLLFARLAVVAENAGEQIAWDRLKIESNFEVEDNYWEPKGERRTVEITAIGINNGN